MGKTVKDFKLKPKYFYILDFNNLLKVRLLKYSFVNKKVATRFLEANFVKKERRFMQIVKGNEASNFMLEYNMNKKRGQWGQKYSYPIHCVTHQDRKSYRTLIRRRLRRMGLLTNVKPIFIVNNPRRRVRHIKNTQKVAMNKNSAAKVIQLERLSEDLYFYIRKVMVPKKNGILFTIRAIRFNNKTGKVKPQILQVRYTDVILPYLIHDLTDLINEKIQKEIQTREYYEEKGFSFPK